MIHPIISVLTGEMKSRGVYIDEPQLDLLSYDMPADIDTIQVLGIINIVGIAGIAGIAGMAEVQIMSTIMLF
jgi:hypothetical protein